MLIGFVLEFGQHSGSIPLFFAVEGQIFCWEGGGGVFLYISFLNTYTWQCSLALCHDVHCTVYRREAKGRCDMITHSSRLKRNPCNPTELTTMSVSMNFLFYG